MSGQKDKRFKLTPVMEDYLETIAIIKRERGVARVRDISSLLQVRPSSVHSAVSNLSKKGFVIHERYGFVDLTPEGERAANDVIKRHGILLSFLNEVLGIDRSVANKDACLMEHSLSSETVRKLMKFVEFVQKCREKNRPEWIHSYEHYYQTGELRDYRK
jgi:DtxR family Mn-dependent transcriptional regulator